MRASNSAIALIPAPATPTMCTRRGVVRSSTGSGGTSMLLDEVGNAGGRVEPPRIAVGIAQHDGGARAFERLRVARLVVARRARQRNEYGRHPCGRELGN